MIHDSVHGCSKRLIAGAVPVARPADSSCPAESGFYRTMPALDLALGLRMIGPAPGMSRDGELSDNACND